MRKYLPLLETFYRELGVEDILNDKNAPVNKLLYKLLSRVITYTFVEKENGTKVTRHLGFTIEEYFSQAYAICTKLTIDKHPENHFLQEYVRDLPSDYTLTDCHIVFLTVYVLLSTNLQNRRQFIMMLEQIYGNFAPHTPLFEEFQEIIEKAWKQNLFNKIDYTPASCFFSKFKDFSPTVGMPHSKKGVLDLVNDIRLCVGIQMESTRCKREKNVETNNTHMEKQESVIENEKKEINHKDQNDENEHNENKEPLFDIVLKKEIKLRKTKDNREIKTPCRIDTNKVKSWIEDNFLNTGSNRHFFEWYAIWKFFLDHKLLENTKIIDFAKQMIKWFPNILKTTESNFAANIRFYHRLIGDKHFKEWISTEIINKIYAPETRGVSEKGFNLICNSITNLNSAYHENSFIVEKTKEES
jgi:hypothetical protein